MDASLTRFKARLVVYYEAVILGLSLSLLIIIGIFLCVGTFSNYETRISKELQRVPLAQDGNQDQNDSQHHIDRKVHEIWVIGVPIPTSTCWISYAVFVVATGIRLWILIGLSKVIGIGTDPKEALRSAMRWSNVTFYFMFLEVLILPFSFIAFAITKGPLYTLSSILFYSFALDFWMKNENLSILYKFVYELKKLPPVYTDI